MNTLISSKKAPIFEWESSSNRHSFSRMSHWVKPYEKQRHLTHIRYYSNDSIKIEWDSTV